MRICCCLCRVPSASKLCLPVAYRSQLSEAERQSSVLKQQQEGAVVRALRQELHSLRQDTNTVAAGARQTISEKEALQARPLSHALSATDSCAPPCVRWRDTAQLSTFSNTMLLLVPVTCLWQALQQQHSHTVMSS